MGEYCSMSVFFDQDQKSSMWYKSQTNSQTSTTCPAAFSSSSRARARNRTRNRLSDFKDFDYDYEHEHRFAEHAFPIGGQSNANPWLD